MTVRLPHDSLELLHDGKSKELIKVVGHTQPRCPDCLPQPENITVVKLCVMRMSVCVCVCVSGGEGRRKWGGEGGYG